jgi:hypothetical protein
MVFNIRLVCVNDERRKVLPRITLGRHVGGAVASLVLNFEIRRRRDEPQSTRKNAETGKGHGEEKLKVEMKRTKKRLAQGAWASRPLFRIRRIWNRERARRRGVTEDRRRSFGKEEEKDFEPRKARNSTKKRRGSRAEARRRGGGRRGEHPTSNIQHPTLNIEHRTLNIEHRTSNIEVKRKW